MSTEGVTMDNLKLMALAEIRSYDGCEDVRDVGIYHVTDDRADSNWSISVISLGAADKNTADRAALYAQSKLRRQYHLMTD